jgi:hypothetical protein
MGVAMTDLSPPKREDAFERLQLLTFGGLAGYLIGWGVRDFSRHIGAGNGPGANETAWDIFEWLGQLVMFTGGAPLVVGLIGYGVYLGVRAAGRPG